MEENNKKRNKELKIKKNFHVPLQIKNNEGERTTESVSLFNKAYQDLLLPPANVRNHFKGEIFDLNKDPIYQRINKGIDMLYAKKAPDYNDPDGFWSRLQ